MAAMAMATAATTATTAPASGISPTSTAIILAAGGPSMATTNVHQWATPCNANHAQTAVEERKKKLATRVQTATACYRLRWPRAAHNACGDGIPEQQLAFSSSREFLSGHPTVMVTVATQNIKCGITRGSFTKSRLSKHFQKPPHRRNFNSFMTVYDRIVRCTLYVFCTPFFFLGGEKTRPHTLPG